MRITYKVLFFSVIVIFNFLIAMPLRQGVEPDILGEDRFLESITKSLFDKRVYSFIDFNIGGHFYAYNMEAPKISYVLPVTYVGITPRAYFTFTNVYKNFIIQTSLGTFFDVPFQYDIKETFSIKPYARQSFLFYNRPFWFFMDFGNIDLEKIDEPEIFRDHYRNKLVVTPRAEIGINKALETDAPSHNDYRYYQHRETLGHSKYEYGASVSLEFEKNIYKFNLGGYISWQRIVDPLHWERFTAGFQMKNTIGIVPLYTAMQLWHNGGQEYRNRIYRTTPDNIPNPNQIEYPSVYEFLNIVAGFRNEHFSALYVLGSGNLDKFNPNGTVYTQGLYMDYYYEIKGFFITPSFWFNKELIDQSLGRNSGKSNYFTVDGFAYANAPLYFKVTLGYKFLIADMAELEIVFENGLFLRSISKGFSVEGFFNQVIHADFHYTFDFYKNDKPIKLKKI